MFNLQIRHIDKLQEKDFDDTTFSGAIESIYGNDDILIINWNNIEVSASIKWDLSDSWFDIKKMIKDLESNKKEFGMQWPSQSFFVYWTFNEIDHLTWEIKTDWDFKTNKAIEVSKKIFLEEWKKTIKKIETDLINQGYSLQAMSFH